MIGCIIQTRNGSSRLKYKAVLPLDNEPVIIHLFNRVKQSKTIEKIIAATTNNGEDSSIEIYSKQCGIECFRGSELDLLDRYYKAAEKYKLSTIVRITGDCPMIDPDIIDMVVNEHIKNNNDYTSNCESDTYPDGLDVSVFSFNALKRSWLYAIKTSEREHIGLYIANNKKEFKTQEIKSDINYSNKRWTLDEYSDYLFLSLIIPKLKKNYRMNDVLELLKENPEYEKINNYIERNEGLRKSLQTDKLC